MKNILLISPAADNEGLWITGNEGPQVLNNMAPLALAVVAGLTPDGFKVQIWDELVHGEIDAGTVFEKDYDLVGITGYKTHLKRSREIAAVFRERSIPVAVGGPGVSGTPQHYQDDFDILFIGEAEKTWPEFLRQWEAGSYRSEYRQINKPDLTESPLPDWSSISAVMKKRYGMGCIQTTRGCPFDCEFCDVIQLFGRQPRHKSIKNILEEVRVMERLDMSSVFFCDDEFSGDPKYTKELLLKLISVNNSFKTPRAFSTQLALSISGKEDLLELLADANFNMLFVGVETPNRESLEETNKRQNLRQDMVAAVHKILSYGIAIRAGMILGFDHDTPEIFDAQYNFIQEACIPSVTINMLKAPIGTRLWARLRREGRVVSLVSEKDRLGHPRSYTNILPKGMSRVELMEGYLGLLERVYSWESFTARICGFVSLIERRPALRFPDFTPEDVEKLIGTLGLGPEGREAVGKIFSHTCKSAPYMAARVKELVVQHVKYGASVAALLPQLRRQIEFERLGKFVFEKDSSPVPVPEAFRDEYESIFKDSCKRVSGGLKDSGKLPEALVEVFVDFLVSSGKGLLKVEAHHRLYLKEICDRTSERYNAEQEDADRLVEENRGLAGPSDDQKQVGGYEDRRLADSVLRTVEQELVALASGGGAAHKYAKETANNIDRENL